MPPGEPSLRSFAFAAGGSRAAWIRDRALNGRAAFEIASLDLNLPGAAPSRMKDALEIVAQLAVSPDGRRVAFLEASVLRVVDAATGDIIAARELADWRVPRSIYFAPDGRLRLCPRARLEPGPSSSHDLLELDPATGALSATGRIPVTSAGSIFRPSARGDVALLLETGRSRIALLDALTGETRAVLPPAGELRGAAFLAGGRIAAVYRAGSNGTAIRIFTSDAREEAAMDLPSPPAAVAVLDEPAPGRLVLASNPVGANSTRTWTVSILDVGRGQVAASWPGFAPLDALEFWTAAALMPLDGNASGRPPFLLNPRGGLTRIDSLAGLPSSGTSR